MFLALDKCCEELRRMEKVLMEKADQVKSPKKEIQRHWNEVAKSWYIPKDSLPAQEYNEAIQKELAAAIGNDAKKTLDVGTGANCRLARSLSTLSHEATAVDVSEEMLSGAKRSCKERDMKVNLIQSWAHELPFVNDTFDAVANRGLFFTLPDPEIAIQEWIRVTKNGGHVIIFELEGLRGFKGFKFESNGRIYPFQKKAHDSRIAGNRLFKGDIEEITLRSCNQTLDIQGMAEISFEVSGNPN